MKNNSACNNLMNNVSNIYKKQPSLKYRSRQHRARYKCNNEFCNSHCNNCYNHGCNYSNNNSINKTPSKCNNKSCKCKNNSCIKKRRPGCCKINPLWWLAFLFFI